MYNNLAHFKISTSSDVNTEQVVGTFLILWKIEFIAYSKIFGSFWSQLEPFRDKRTP